MRSKLLHASTGLVLGLMAGLAASADGPATDPEKARFERQFLEQMPHHHQMGLPMLQMCEQKATHGDLKNLCRETASKQQGEAEQMRGWLQSWYQGKGAMSKAEMNRMMSESKTDMAKLQAATGQDFDRVFMMTLMKHHRQGIQMSKDAETRVEHPELKDLARKMAEDQQTDNQRMEGWLHEWYPGRSGGGDDASHESH